MLQVVLAVTHLVLAVWAEQGSEECPVWTTYNSTAGQCECGDSLGGVVRCLPSTLKVSLLRCYCMTYNEEANTTVVGPCIFLCADNYGKNEHCYTFNNYFETNSTHLLNQKICGPFNRRGQLCSRCLPNYALPVYSYRSLNCTQCERSEFVHNLFKYMCVAFLPLTMFYLVVITFKISITSGNLTGYILICQLFTSPTMVRQFVGKKGNQHFNSYFTLSLFLIWNLDFFRPLYSPFCIHPDMSTLQVLALDYLVGVYPLLLILLTYIAVLLHDRYSIVVRVCRPLYTVLRCVRREWHIRGSLIQAFATFFLLSYVKILNVSFDLLFPVQLKDVKGKVFKDQMYLYNDAEVVYFGSEHLPYGILALVMLLIFNILPILLLLLYPCGCFQRCLNCCGVRSQLLHMLMDVFQGCYRHHPRDCRYFAGLYLCVRILVLVTFLFIHDKAYFVIAGCYFIAIAIGFQFVKPYKKDIHNQIDVLFFLLSALTCFCYGARQDYSFFLLPKFFSAASSSTLFGIIFLYGSAVIIHQILPSKIFLSFKNCCQQCISRRRKVENGEHVYRFDVQEEAPLL